MPGTALRLATEVSSLIPTATSCRLIAANDHRRGGRFEAWFESVSGARKSRLWARWNSDFGTMLKAYRAATNAQVVDSGGFATSNSLRTQ